MTINLRAYADAFPDLIFAEPSEAILDILIAGGPDSVSKVAQRDLALVWRRIDADDEVRVVLLRSACDSAALGNEDHLAQMDGAESALSSSHSVAPDLFQDLVNCVKPVVSAFRGGGGAWPAIALLSDVSIVARRARIVLSQIWCDTAAAGRPVACVPWLGAHARARDYLLTNTVMSGEEAERIGIVARAVATRRSKRALNAWLRASNGLSDATLASECLGFQANDMQQAVQAMIARRA